MHNNGKSVKIPTAKLIIRHQRRGVHGKKHHTGTSATNRNLSRQLSSINFSTGSRQSIPRAIIDGNDFNPFWQNWIVSRFQFCFDAFQWFLQAFSPKTHWQLRHPKPLRPSPFSSSANAPHLWANTNFSHILWSSVDVPLSLDGQAGIISMSSDTL